MGIYVKFMDEVICKWGSLFIKKIVRFFGGEFKFKGRRREEDLVDVDFFY